METNQSSNRDYSTISPSAKALLLLKGLTNIPFAKEAAALAANDGTPELVSNQHDLAFWGRVIHFESRYGSIDQLLEGLDIKNILELSSGFSFRGLEAVRNENVHYIDTDLPEVIAAKKEFVAALQEKEQSLKGRLELLALNALDEQAFNEIVDRFNERKVVIVNEGLLMYLGVEEKKQLCRIIHRVLEKRGGYWITADIYTMRQFNDPKIEMKDDALNRFFEQHKIRENTFESFEAAKAFFEEAGFVIDKQAEMDVTKLSALEQLKKVAAPEQLADMRKMGSFRETWRLKIAE